MIVDGDGDGDDGGFDLDDDDDDDDALYFEYMYIGNRSVGSLEGVLFLFFLRGKFAVNLILYLQQ